MVASRSNKKNPPKSTDQVVKPLNNVEKQFYELQIADLHKRLIAFKQQNEKIESENEELQNKIKEISEDRRDASIHTNRVLEEKDEKIQNLKSEIVELKKNYKDDSENFKIKLCENDDKFKMTEMDINLLTAKCDSLVEFRNQREALNAKFQLQEQEKIDQENRHKEVLYEMERKLIVDKEKLRKDVDQKLLDLSNEFTMKNEIRVAASTQRLVRENIAINLEMDQLMFTVERLQKENHEFQRKCKEISDNFQTHMDEKKRLIKTGQQQYKIIKNLTEEIENMKIMNIKNEKENERLIYKKYQEKLTENHKKIQILEKNVHQLSIDLENCKSYAISYQDETQRLSQIMKKLGFHIESVIRGETVQDDPPFREHQRKNLLKNLLALIDESKNQPELPQINFSSNLNEHLSDKISATSTESMSEETIEEKSEEITLFDVESGSYEFPYESPSESEADDVEIDKRKTLMSVVWNVRNSENIEIVENIEKQEI